MNLPDINEIYPQKEQESFGFCIKCNEELFVGDTILIDGGYPYCDDDCMKLLRVSEGNAEWRIAGE